MSRTSKEKISESKELRLAFNSRLEGGLKMRHTFNMGLSSSRSAAEAL
jgi:hypothetical protein